LAAAWPYLDSDDYHLRYAARIAIEWQDTATWAEKAYNESNDRIAIHALLGLARRDLAGSLAPTIKRLNRVTFHKLNTDGKLALLRTYAVVMSRHGMPETALKKAVGDTLDPHYPAKDDNVNEELCRVLSYLQHPSVVSKTVALMKITKAKATGYDAELMKRNSDYGGLILRSMKTNPNILNIHYLFCLKDVTVGWTMADREFYLGWVKELLTKRGGHMYRGYLHSIRKDAIAAVPEKDMLALQYVLGEVKTIDLAKLPKASGPGVGWTVEGALKMLAEPLQGRDLANGKKMFSAGMCVACHRFGRTGGGVGPDLTNLSKRSDYRSMLESIITPNLVVSDQFEQHEITLQNGTTVMGRVVSEQGAVLSVVQSGFEPRKLTRVKVADVASKKASKLSMMPAGMINTMNAEELKDLIAYFVSQGDKGHAVYRKK
jgi:putative heme-binding domain-containing protein